MADRVGNRRALVSGAAGGIGLATARLLCSEGADVALIDIDSARAKQAGEAISSACPERHVSTFGVDVSRETECAEVVHAAVSGLGGLDIVVVCAAVRAYYTLAEAPAESWERILAVNLLGTQNLLKAALPSLRKKSGSSVVIVSSVFAGVGRRGMGQYDATKAALISLTRTLAVEESDYGIRVNAVCPGSVWTPYTVSRAEARGMTEKELRDKGAIRALLNRWAEPEEIAYPILWLASEEASFITGTSLTVDGGYSVT